MDHVVSVGGVLCLEGVEGVQAGAILQDQPLQEPGREALQRDEVCLVAS